MAMHKKTFSVDIDDELSELFSNQVLERGFTKYRALEGALRAFTVLPAEKQAALMVDGANTEQVLIDYFRDLALDRDLENLTPQQKKRMQQFVKTFSEQFCRKSKGRSDNKR